MKQKLRYNSFSKAGDYPGEGRNPIRTSTWKGKKFEAMLLKCEIHYYHQVVYPPYLDPQKMIRSSEKIRFFFSRQLFLVMYRYASLMGLPTHWSLPYRGRRQDADQDQPRFSVAPPRPSHPLTNLLKRLSTSPSYAHLGMSRTFIHSFTKRRNRIRQKG